MSFFMFKAKNPIKCEEGDFVEMLPYLLEYPFKIVCISLGGFSPNNRTFLCILTPFSFIRFLEFQNFLKIFLKFFEKNPLNPLKKLRVQFYQ